MIGGYLWEGEERGKRREGGGEKKGEREKRGGGSNCNYTARVSADTECKLRSYSGQNCYRGWKREPQGQRPDVRDSKEDNSQPGGPRRSPKQVGLCKLLLNLPSCLMT